MKQSISRLPDFVKGKRRGTGEGLNEHLLPEGASWTECGSVQNASESGHESPTTPGEGGSSYEDGALERTTSPQSMRSSDYSHSSTAIQASEGGGAQQRHERSICLPDVMRQIPRTRGGLNTVEGGGVEAVPTVRGDDVRVALHNEGFQSLVQLLPTAGPGCAATHAQVRDLLERERVSKFGIYRNDRCALLLENGPELACAVLLCMARCTCVPINIQQTSPEIRAELQGTGCKALIVQQGQDLHWVRSIIEGLPVCVLQLVPDPITAGIFSLVPWDAATLAASEEGVQQCARKQEPGNETGHGYNGPLDTALVLHTSGTSGNKKKVPYTLETLCVGAACIVDSWGLVSEDVCLNMMPLFHVGGITRNVLAAILSGGGVVCAPAFDAGLFWQVLEARSGSSAVTWYYAGPTMHSMILEQLAERRTCPQAAGFTPRLRMVANASGGLTASLAEHIQSAFGAVVLPSYGMTECMPISSPSCDYSLDHPNSSGQICGPTVRILDDSGLSLPMGEVGNIALKGSPLMEGYLHDEAANQAAFFPGGWFNTGDMGYLDEQGWIYLTGRSKEVINRGGEIISPFEIEEAICGHARVKAAMAFSAPHTVLQEVVGVAIVPDPAQPRVDLAGLQKYVAAKLHPSKWPQVLVYMNELPKGQANKVQRIRLAQRLGLHDVTDQAPLIMRMFEAQCPQRCTSLHVPIDCAVVHVDLQKVMEAIKTVQKALGIAQCVVISVAEKEPGACVVYVSPRAVDADALRTKLHDKLHGYEMPKDVILLDEIPEDCRSLPPPTWERQEEGFIAPRTPTEALIQTIWEKVLGKTHVGVETDFFEAGGSSLLAGRLVALIRRELGVALTAAAVFGNRTIAALAATSEAMQSSLEQPRAAGDKGPLFLPERNHGNPRWVDRCKEHELLQTTDGWVTSGFEGLGKDRRLTPHSQTAVCALLCQALPLVVLYPLRRICTWLFFVAIWLSLQTYYLPVKQTCAAVCSCPVVGNHTVNHTIVPNSVVPTPTCSDNSGLCACRNIVSDRLSALILALFIGRLVAYIVFPLLAIATKWVVIGRYRPGRYPLWGQYYLRWWFVDQVLMICGRGVFRYSPWLLNLYYRMMGAKIGPRVVIDARAKMGEFDLITIGADSAVDNVRLRAFCLDNGCMLLAPLHIGENVSVARKVHLAPGIEVPDNAAFGPNSSSYDLNPFTTREDNRRFCAARFPKPNPCFCAAGYLVLLLVFVLEQLPVLIVLVQMVSYPWYMHHLRSYRDVIIWFLTPGRVGFYVAIRIVRNTACPIVRLAAVLALKKTIIGKFEPGPWTHSQRKILRRWLMERLLSGEKLQEVGHLIGSHYGFMTWVLRALGANVGERIYWPGSNFEGLVEYDLLEVQDDVVFGSRSAILCADAVEAAPICIEAGANVSDRCVLLPGCSIGRNAVLGSGSLTARGTHYPAGSKWVGSRGGKVMLLERGNAEAAEADTLKPFGKAFYLGLAPFRVHSSWVHLLVNSFSRCFAAAFRSLTLISVIQLSAVVIGEWRLKTAQCTLPEIAAVMIPLFLCVQNVMTVLALAIAIGLKHAIIGKRRPGLYNWDESSYCQRWQIYLSATVIIRKAYYGNGILDHLNGSAYLVWFFRAHGCHIGKDVCLYPTGADPIMTEPELVQIGSRAAIDDASLIAHINSRGQFSLNAVVVSAGATLRAHSRLLSGATMMPHSTLLEHTLVLGGDVVDEGDTVQGWPAESVGSYSPFWRVSDLPAYGDRGAEDGLCTRLRAISVQEV